MEREMLGDKEAIATIAVKDLAVAKEFYEGALGLKLASSQGSEAVTFKSGSSKVVVYRSQYAGTNQATVVNWMVGDQLGDIVEGLKKRGVAFEHYDIPQMTRQGDIHSVGSFQAVWFKDPDGNILSLTSSGAP
jgi:catechol 2,3-dioxygenase-like lactoylglutathione lyase family enzyme